VVARAPLVPRVWPRYRALDLGAEHDLDGGVDVEVNRRGLERAQRREAVLTDHRVEVAQGLVVEAPQVVVERVDGGHVAARQELQEGIGRQRLQVEDAVVSEYGEVHEEAQLGGQGVDHRRPALEASEEPREVLVDARPPQEARPADEPRGAGQGSGRWPRRECGSGPVDGPASGAGVFVPARACLRGQFGAPSGCSSWGSWVCLATATDAHGERYFQGVSRIVFKQCPPDFAPNRSEIHVEFSWHQSSRRAPTPGLATCADRCPHRAESRCRAAILCRAQREAGLRGMPTFWGWSRAAQPCLPLGAARNRYGATLFAR
jgi:hypothetical protein